MYFLLQIENYLKQNNIKINDKNTTNAEKRLLEKDRGILVELNNLLKKCQMKSEHYS